MLQDISWNQFLTALIILVVPYYTFIIWKYFRADIRHFLKSPSLKKLQLKIKRKPSATSVVLTEEQFADTFREIEQITYDLRHSILSEAGKSKEKLWQLLAQRLAHFNGLNVPAFRLTLSQQLQDIAKSRQVTLEPAEIEAFWQRLLVDTPTT